MSVLIFIKDLLIATLGQMAVLFGGVTAAGLLLHLVSHLTYKSLENAFGSKGVFAVAWLGTPVHELGHAIFCPIFMHRIEEMQLFHPNPATGTLGYVNHTWDRRNPWAVMGNFFIGIGPVIMDGAVLFGLFYWLVPGSRDIGNIGAGLPVSGDSLIWKGYLDIFTDASLAVSGLLFTPDNLLTWQFWLFLYLAVCISSSLRLSVADIRTAASGLGMTVLPFLVLNLIGMLTGSGDNGWLSWMASYLGTGYGVLVLALVPGMAGLVIVYLISAAWYRIRYRRVLNPFR